MDGAGEVAPGPGVWVGAAAPGLAGAVAVGVLEGEGVTAAWRADCRNRRA
jgi:hypothetical protein